MSHDAALPNTLAECHAWMREMVAVHAQQQATIEEQQATIDEQQRLLKSLQRDLALLKRALFGQRRERFEDPRQGILFDGAEVGPPQQTRALAKRTRRMPNLRLGVAADDADA